MGVNLTKEVKEAIGLSIKTAEADAAAAAAEAAAAPPANDCDTVKTKNFNKFAPIFQEFIIQNKGNIPVVFKTGFMSAPTVGGTSPEEAEKRASGESLIDEKDKQKTADKDVSEKNENKQFKKKYKKAEVSDESLG